MSFSHDTEPFKLRFIGATIIILDTIRRELDFTEENSHISCSKEEENGIHGILKQGIFLL